MKKLTVIVKPVNREVYRGTMSGPNVLMKCKFETVGDDKTIEVLKGFLEKKLCTGNIGDGKIFVEKVADVIRVRTGQRGEEAL